MLTLIIDTSAERPAVGLSDAPGRIRVAEASATRHHGRDLVPAIRDLLASESRSVRDLQVIGVGIGPGSYTGLRIGLTAAKVLAYASSAVLVPFDSLEAVAQNAPEDAMKVVAASDAQRGDVYAAEFSRPAPGGPLLKAVPSRVVAADVWASRLQEGTVVLGPALVSPRLRALIPAHIIVDESIPATPRGGANSGAHSAALDGRTSRRPLDPRAQLPATKRGGRSVGGPASTSTLKRLWGKEDNARIVEPGPSRPEIAAPRDPLGAGDRRQHGGDRPDLRGDGGRVVAGPTPGLPPA